MAEKEAKEKNVKTPAKAKKGAEKIAEVSTMVIEKKPTKEAATPKPRAKVVKSGTVHEKGEKDASIAGNGLKRVPGNTKTPEEVKPEGKSVASPSREEIAHLAHRFWKERGGHHGSHEQDWFRAEQELRGKAS